jgi:hypothetical protein
MSKVGYQDIDFPSHPRFADHYLLRGPGSLIDDLLTASREEDIRTTFTPAVPDAWESTGIVG